MSPTIVGIMLDSAKNAAHPTDWAIEPRQAALESMIAQLLANGTTNPRALSKSREAFGSQITERLISVANLQAKAARKFSMGSDIEQPRIWWATDRSLQQSTPWQVAHLKAGWLGNGLVYDLCCGIGGDAMQLSRQGPVIAVDSDPLIAQMAKANLANANPEHSAEVLASDVTAISIPAEASIHIDPDRRVEGRRTSNPDSYQPAWSNVIEMATRVESALIKLAPAAEMEPGEFDAHRCWISLRGSVREQTLLLGQAMDRANVQAQAKSAVTIVGNGTATSFVPPSIAQGRYSLADQPQQYMIDPDAAIRAAGLTQTFAEQNQLSVLGKLSGFLTCPDAASLRLVQSQAIVGSVIWSGSCDDRKLRRELRSRGMYPSVIKVRGTDHDPATLVKRYRKCGEKPITLWIGKSAKRAYAVMTVPSSV
ncbi:MAG: hypothetical protein AB8B91_01305 [Rubripirellula sp.]